ncbi:hypothetical protein BRAS3843_1640010 [Bradyrhizobium sp. STM 3843]|nr:hypothetical protein BRAS3843_1640010 [Bradyrhizobium sp. STM 3843]
MGSQRRSAAAAEEPNSMQRPDMHSNNYKVEVSILELFERFTFSILPCQLELARASIKRQGELWGKSFVFDRPSPFDVRLIYNSPDGPDRAPAVNIGILLSEVEGVEGRKTLFVSSVADGYSSMITCISREIPGTHLTFAVSRPKIRYPGCSFRAIRDGETVRTVYAMLDNSWVFFERGSPLPFEEVDLYSARRKRDRLSVDILSSYIGRLGYGSLKTEFWIRTTAPAQLMATNGFRIGGAQETQIDRSPQ